MGRAEQQNKHQDLQILLVEDSEDNQLVFQYLLQSFGASVDPASNGKEAVEKFTNGTYDLVLMDLQMPIMDGYTATRMMREWEKEHQLPAVPIVALTASSTAEELQQAFDAGCIEHLKKPVQREALQKLFFQVCEEKDKKRYTVILDPDLEELLPTILEIKRKQVQELQTAFDHEDFQEIQSLGHKMKGSHGLETINDLAQSIESAAKEKKLPTIQVLLNQLHDYLDHIDIRFRQE